ncbi:PREDICTED: uncharacterized protein LOC104590582 [Nelumbo nucifera]|uniref:Uncharacterized protein LOC104590582 n=2 Tax=Nelumbo nucifera TaxID=4432 RepID=A0A1U7Z966_NELNU|nr:PREDICTED: uncharacterized protein LOC104590582 [Nelumbo nucifera]DAD27193.1 TPA_asm: hypothetical protein HUJ06_028661 [Nelumbo nucifera]
MISPTPSSLCYAIVLCFPLILFFATTTARHTNLLNLFLLTNYNGKIIMYPPSPPPPPPPPPPPEGDDELFRVASQVNPNPEPTSARKKIAFMFLTTTPLPLAPLWEHYFHQNQTKQQPRKQKPEALFNIYIHADPSYAYDPPFRGVFSGRVIYSKPTQRGSPTLISSARRLLAHALLHDSTNAMFALLSSTCIPLHSFAFTYNALLQSNQSFIEILKDEPGIYDRYMARGADVMMPEVPFESFRVGSQFFILTRRHARLVVQDERLWAKFKLPCISPQICYPEEHYFSTLLSMEDSLGCVPATLTNVNWRWSQGGHPHTYGASEVGSELIISLRRDRLRYGNGGDWNSSETVRNHTFLFARKFPPESLEMLMSLASDVIFRE